MNHEQTPQQSRSGFYIALFVFGVSCTSLGFVLRGASYVPVQPPPVLLHDMKARLPVTSEIECQPALNTLPSAIATSTPVKENEAHADSFKLSFASVPGAISPLAFPPANDVCPIKLDNWAVAHNPRFNYDLVTYGREDFISNVCLRGGEALFFEEHDSRYIIDLLNKFDEERPSASMKTGSALFFSRPWLLDFGTNIGVHTIAAGKAGFGVLGVEANPATAARLACSIALNKFAHVHLVGAALGGRDGPSSVCVEVPNAGNVGTAFVRGGSCAVGQASVPVLVIDDLFAALPESLPAPSVLKMDIEGFELLALRGAEKWLARRPPKIVLIEIHPEWTARAGVQWKDLALFWLNHGYHGWIPQPSGTSQPGPELLKSDFSNEQAVLARLANCQYNAYFTLEPILPVPLPPKICENHRRRLR